MKKFLFLILTCVAVLYANLSLAAKGQILEIYQISKSCNQEPTWTQDKPNKSFIVHKKVVFAKVKEGYLVNSETLNCVGKENTKENYFFSFSGDIKYYIQEHATFDSSYPGGVKVKSIVAFDRYGQTIKNEKQFFDLKTDRPLPSDYKIAYLESADHKVYHRAQNLPFYHLFKR